jgi:hypothetical protein
MKCTAAIDSILIHTELLFFSFFAAISRWSFVDCVPVVVQDCACERTFWRDHLFQGGNHALHASRFKLVSTFWVV